MTLDSISDWPGRQQKGFQHGDLARRLNFKEENNNMIQKKKKSEKTTYHFTCDILQETLCGIHNTKQNFEEGLCPFCACSESRRDLWVFLRSQ